MSSAVAISSRNASAADPAIRRRASRIASMDFVRGTVMILMAIDHVRVYSGVPAGGPTPGVFFTRWITHFAAPAFVFLAGTAAYLHGRKLNDPALLTRFLLMRGAKLARARDANNFFDDRIISRRLLSRLNDHDGSRLSTNLRIRRSFSAAHDCAERR